jgi:hypothetical protein
MGILPMWNVILSVVDIYRTCDGPISLFQRVPESCHIGIPKELTLSESILNRYRPEGLNHDSANENAKTSVT